MKVELFADYAITDDACQASTGRTLSAWLADLDARSDLKGKRQDALSWLYDGMGRGKDRWWPTTVWVVHEAGKGVVQKDGRPEGYNICVTKTVAAPVDKVFAAWHGEPFTEWFGDAGSVDADRNITDATGNLGDAVRVRMDKDLRYKWKTAGLDVPTDLDIAFVEKACKTTITLTHSRIQTREEADGLRRAWIEAFVRLKELLEL